MIFRPFYRFDTGCAAYVFGCGSHGVGAVVDPRDDDVGAYLSFADSVGLRITHVIDTHVHADHRSGGPALAASTGATYCLHRAADTAHEASLLDDGQVIELGNTVIEVLHTPGHTPDSICLLVRDLRRGPEPWFVLTGDTLFSGAVGRPDLPGRPVDDARRLHASIQRLLALPDDVEVHPAHFGGSACGAGLSGKPVTTIGFERRWNPLLTAGADDFVRRVGTDLPSPPAGADETVAHNRGLR